MNTRTGRAVAMIGLAGLLVAIPPMAGCTNPVGTSPSSPVVAPVDTAPEPLENSDLQDSPQEESESVHATGTP